MEIRKLRHLDLFSGIGGFSLGLERTGGFETVAFCEIEPFCQKVLKKHWPDVPIYDDVRTLDADGLGNVDIITGGYPCQPFSLAGKRDGEEDDRHLWPEMFRIIQAFRPAWVIGENVAGHISMGLDQVLFDLESADYACQAFVIPACAVDAPHRRDRVWIIAARTDTNTHRQRSHRAGINEQREVESVDGQECELGPVREVLAGRRDTTERNSSNVANTGQRRRGGQDGGQGEQPGRAGTVGTSEDVADADRSRPQGRGRLRQCTGQRSAGSESWTVNQMWLPEPDVGRVAHGISIELDLIGGLVDAKGNYSKAQPKAQRIVWKILRAMWSYRKLATSSPKLYVRRIHDTVPEVPHRAAHGGWLLGRRIEEDEELRSLWQEFYTEPFEEAQNLQQRVLERAWKKKRPQEMGLRVDRLKGLGNAVVPQIPEIIGRAILEIERWK